MKRNTLSLRESLPGIYRRLQAFAQAERALSDHWPNARQVALRWDESRQVLATDSALDTYRAIYGNDLIRGLRHIWNTARGRREGEPRGESPEALRIETPLPPDAVVIPQRSQDRTGTPYVLTVVSAREQCVVKIFSRERKSRFENELNAWRLAQAAGIGHRVPRLIASGESPNGFCWLVSGLVRNSAVHPPVIGDWLWRRYLVRQIMPDLRRLYEIAGVEVLSGCAWLDRFRAEIAGHPMSARLQKLVDLAEAARQGAGDDRIPLALIHGDLSPHNVHRHAGQWWLIDWSMSRRAPIMIDLWPNPSNALANEVFGAWLRGHASMNELPGSLRAPLDMYADWQAPWFGIKLDRDGLRFQTLAVLAHRLSRNHGAKSSLSVATFKALGIRD